MKEIKELKSPTGGLFKIFIDGDIIYKKNCRKRPIYKKKHKKFYFDLLKNITEIEIIGKYGINATKIDENGGYYSKYLGNSIRLYDCAENKLLTKEIWRDICVKLEELVMDLCDYNNKHGSLIGDWALHNIIYDLDTKRLYNIDLEGFYTYPKVHNNGNCDFKMTLERVLGIISSVSVL